MALMRWQGVEEVSLMQTGDELVIHAGRHRRSVVLPRHLTGLEIQKATVDGNILKLRFNGEERARRKAG